MNKTDLVAAVAAQAGLTKAQAQKAVEATVDAIAGALKGGDKVQLVGFGTFSVVEKALTQQLVLRSKSQLRKLLNSKLVLAWLSNWLEAYNELLLSGNSFCVKN